MLHTFGSATFYEKITFFQQGTPSAAFRESIKIIGNTVGANCVRPLENDQYQRNSIVGNAVLSVPKKQLGLYGTGNPSPTVTA